MLVTLTSENQLTLPREVLSAFPGTQYFDVSTEDGRIVLTPMRVNRANLVRARMAKLNLSESDVADAVAWARRSNR